MGSLATLWWQVVKLFIIILSIRPNCAAILNRMAIAKWATNVSSPMAKTIFASSPTTTLTEATLHVAVCPEVVQAIKAAVCVVACLAEAGSKTGCQASSQISEAATTNTIILAATI